MLSPCLLPKEKQAGLIDVRRFICHPHRSARYFSI
jgi:hypothetical protein